MAKKKEFDRLTDLPKEKREDYFERVLLPDDAIFEEAASAKNAKGELALQYVKDTENHLARIIFNSPETKNAIRYEQIPLMIRWIRQAEYDDDVKVLIFEARGEDFGTGFDAGALGYYIGFGDGKSKEGLKRPSQRRRIWPDRDLIFGPSGIESAMANFTKVSIFAAHGYCYGLHMQLLFHGDLAVATEDTLFSHPAWRYLGPIFDYVAAVETMGIKRMKELLFTGGPFTAQMAYDCGMVNKVVPNMKELDKAVNEYAAAVQSRPMDGIVMGKALITMCMESRGQTTGGMGGWIGHPWMTNQVFLPYEYNFTKSRRDQGINNAFEGADMQLPPQFRLSRKNRQKK